MCLAIPMQIDALESPTHGMCASEGVRQPVDLTLIDSPAIGDYVIVHAGFAIERLDAREAAERIEWFREIAAANDGAAP